MDAIVQHWLKQLGTAQGRPVTIRSSDMASLSCLISEALARQQCLLIETPDDQILPELSNAIDLSHRPLCLVLPGADYVCRIALRATLSLLKSRLTRQDAEGSIWAAQQQRLSDLSYLWETILAWSARGLRNEPWPIGFERLFPIRILPTALAHTLPSAVDWHVILDNPAGALAFADETLRLRSEIEVLTQELSELELEWATAQAEVAEFTRRYHQLVGTRMTMLDQLQATLINTKTAHEQARRSRKESEQFARIDAAECAPFLPTGEIKKLYRKLAQKIHPDRAKDEADRAWRTQLMSEANRAYRSGDETALQEVIALWQEGNTTVILPSKTNLSAQLLRLQRRIEEIEHDLNHLFGSKLYELFTAANMARRAGRDLLQELADKLDIQIAEARKGL